MSLTCGTMVIRLTDVIVQIRHSAVILTIVTQLLLLSGCNALDCVINNHPEFSKTSVNQARLNQTFKDSIKASISNSLEDRKFNYAISLTGDLPDGISYQSSGSEITFAGTPTELGEFPFTLQVIAEPKFLGSNSPEDSAPEALCSDTETINMVFSVVQGF